MNIQKDINPKASRRVAKAAKREAKKREIAQSAISALKTYGYAKTTLRDIADQSDLSLGMLHYYFDDKEQLLIYCVRLYKEEFVAKMNDVLTSASSTDHLVPAFTRALAETIRNDADIHRLWYDIRGQAMFDERFQPVVTELEGMLQDLLRPFATEPSQAHHYQEVLYAQVDGVFRFLLQRRTGGEELSENEMQEMLAAPLGGLHR